MTTTLTLNDDLAKRIEEFAKQNALTFDQALEQTIQHGLLEVHFGKEPPSVPFRQKSYIMGTYDQIDYNKTARILADLEQQALHEDEREE